MRSGLSLKQIRYLEGRNYITDVSRIVCGERVYRVYTEEDLLILQRIKGYLDQGFTLKVSSEKANTGKAERKQGYGDKER